MKWCLTRPLSLFWPPTLVLLMAAVAFLTPLAHASPTDPTWMMGIYDAGDFDDVILLVDSTSGTPAHWSGDARPLVLAPADLNPASWVRVYSGRPSLAFEGRGPPTS